MDEFPTVTIIIKKIVVLLFLLRNKSTVDGEEVRLGPDYRRTPRAGTHDHLGSGLRSYFYLMD